MSHKQVMIDAAVAIEAYDPDYIISFARLWYVLVSYKQHMEWRLSLEQFMQLWDAGLDLLDASPEHMDMFEWATSKKAVLWNKYRHFAPAYIEKYLQIDDMRWANTVFILEKKVRDEYWKQQLLEWVLQARGSSIVLI